MSPRYRIFLMTECKSVFSVVYRKGMFFAYPECIYRGGWYYQLVVDTWTNETIIEQNADDFRFQVMIGQYYNSCNGLIK